MQITPVIIDVGIVAVHADGIAEISLGRMDIHHTLALSLVELIHLSLADGTLPVCQCILIIQREIIGEIADGSLEIAQYAMSDGTTHQYRLLLLDILRHTQFCRKLIDEREDLHRTVLIQLLLGTYDINLVLHLLVHCLHILVKSLYPTHILSVREVRKLEHRQIGSLYLAVLDSSTILALVVMLILRLIIHHNRGELVWVYLRTLAHLLLGLRTPARLDTEMLVHLRLENAELIQLCLRRHTQSAIAMSTGRKTSPEVRKLIDYRSIIADSRLQVSRLVMQQRTVEYRHEVLRLHLDDEVEIGDGTVVITQLHTHQSTVVVSEEVVRIQVDSGIIVAHRTSQIVDVDTSQCSVDVTVYIVRLEVKRFGERLISHLPFLPCKRHIGTCNPGIPIVWIQLQALVEPLLSLHRILLVQIHLSLQGVGIRIILPLGDDRIKLQLCLVVILRLHLAERTVEPVVAVAGFQSDGRIIVGNGIIITLLTDAADGTQVVDIVDIGIEINRL